MQFPTLAFAIFFAFVYVVAIPLKNKVKDFKIFLLVVSIAFYGLFGKDLMSGLQLIGILTTVIFLNYIFIWLVSPFNNRIRSTKVKKVLFVVGLILNILLLVFYKYYKNAFNLLLAIDPQTQLQFVHLLVPIGISFFTFRIISHLIDCYKGKVTIPIFLDYATYISFFPQIAIGPISRAPDFYASLNNPNHFKPSSGTTITLIASGLFKKLAMASYIYPYISGHFENPMDYTSTSLIIAGFAYSVMLYADFSGYSDLSIAISGLLGFKIEPNFNVPYKSIGLKEFWSRWHISLSTWLRDYIYIPLGGNMKNSQFIMKLLKHPLFNKIFSNSTKKASIFFKYINIFITMVISGLWHGAGLTFLVWGALHAVGTTTSHYIQDMLSRKDKIFTKLNTAIKVILLASAWLITQFYIMIAWIYFNSTDITKANQYIQGIFKSGGTESYYSNRLILLILLFYIGSWVAPQLIERFTKFLDKLSVPILILVSLVIFYAIISLGPDLMPPFIYFNF